MVFSGFCRLAIVQVMDEAMDLKLLTDIVLEPSLKGCHVQGATFYREVLTYRGSLRSRAWEGIV